MQSNRQAVMKAEGSPKRSLQKQEPWTAEDQAALALVLGQIFDMQKQFGKHTGQLENIINGFCWALKAYPVQTVVDALAEYIRLHSDMPTPSDIVKIIHPPLPVWKPDWNYAAGLRKMRQDQGSYALNDDEIAYLAKCDDLALDQAKSDERKKD